MGRFDFQMPDDFLKQLGKLADVDRIAPAMLIEAAPIVEKSIKQSLELSTGPDASGEMVASVSAKNPKHNRHGWFITVRPSGRDSVTGIRNMEKAAWLEYGTRRFAARPWATRGIKNAEPEVLDKMQKAFEREVKK